jgi:ectoine hydroxylase-related dioxygenase (phytanoyl-CoA dioxygenase family)
MAQLSSVELEHYRRDGYVVPQFRLPANKIQALQSSLNRLLSENPNVRPEKLVSAHIEGKNDEGVRGSKDFLDLAMDKDILDLVAQAIGPDIILWGCHIFCKPAGTGYETPWHQDGHYWPIRPLATCTVWVALEDSLIENGCLRVIPGSHRNQILHPHLHEDRDDLTLNQRMVAGSFDEQLSHDIELQAGQMSLHDVFMIHGAAANTSAKRRTGVALRYMPGSSQLDRSLNPSAGKTGVGVNWTTRPLWLLRGEDRTGKNDFSIGHRH